MQNSCQFDDRHLEGAFFPGAVIEEGAIELFSEYYGQRLKFKFPLRYAWLHYGPSGYSESSLRSFFARDESGKFVGHSGNLKLPFIFDEAFTSVSWSIDTFVLPNGRGKGFGKSLQRDNQESSELFASLSMSEANEKIKVSLGGVYGPDILQFRAGIMTLLAGLVMKRHLNGPRDIKIELLDFPCRHDYSFILECQRQFKYHVVKDQAFLYWRYLSCPHADYLMFKLFSSAPDKQEVVGYIIGRRATEQSSSYFIICELFFKTGNESCVSDALVALGLRYKISEFHLSAGGSRFCRSVRSIGFREYGRSASVFFRKSGWADGMLQDFSENSQFTGGDHDIDQYPNFNRGGALNIFLRPIKRLVKRVIGR